MAAISLSLSHSQLCSPSLMQYYSQLQEPMLPLLLLAFSLLSFSLLFLSLYKKLRKTEEQTQNPKNALCISDRTSPKTTDKTHKTHVPTLTHLTHSLPLEISPSASSKWATALFNGDSTLEGERGRFYGEECGRSVEEQRGEKKRKKTKKKQQISVAENRGDLMPKKKLELVSSSYPFTSSSSVVQRKIKQQYDELMKCHKSKGLTLAQVGEFANCLVDAKKELLHKFDAIQRKFTITKALLLKADRSSFDRLGQQIHKLELEHKRLEEDAVVYNWLQQQLKLSPAYKKMFEAGPDIESKAKPEKLMESTDTDCAEISFEDFLAQEKKDSFWQKNGKLRSIST